MDERKRQKLQSIGIDLDEALERFMGREEMMLKFLLRFPQDPNFCQCKEAMEHKDTDAAYAAAHSLKGVVGNLSIKPLFRRASQLCDQLREKNLAGAGEEFGALEEEYQRAVETLLELE